MAYVNVAEWKPEQVTEWLKGLDNAILTYVHSFLNNEVNGQQLLNLRPDDLDHLGVHKLGHQELILEAVEHLRNFHYELDRENLQLLALRLSCRARSLYKELLHHTDAERVSTQTLADVANIITAVKPIACWLGRSPFTGNYDYHHRKMELLNLSLEIATCAQRDRWAERPVEEIRRSCDELASLADSIIRDIQDPLLLQPASLDLATVKKRVGDDLGFFIQPSFHGIHQISELKFSSPAQQCGKIEEGDEVVQVNYQTVVGWQSKKVMFLLEESPTDVFLTLKKRPRHTKVYGQIYIKPYRLPSKKRATPYTRWHENLPSPRPELLTIPDFEIPLPRASPKQRAIQPEADHLVDTEPLVSSSSSGDDDDDDGAFLPGVTDLAQVSPTSMRLYLPKQRASVQRRATVTGASPTSRRPPVNIEQFWRELQLEHQWRGSGRDTGAINTELCQLREKPLGISNSLMSVADALRPTTCLGIEQSMKSSLYKDSYRYPQEKIFNKPICDNANKTKENKVPDVDGSEKKDTKEAEQIVTKSEEQGKKPIPHDHVERSYSTPVFKSLSPDVVSDLTKSNISLKKSPEMSRSAVSTPVQDVSSPDIPLKTYQPPVAGDLSSTTQKGIKGLPAGLDDNKDNSGEDCASEHSNNVFLQDKQRPFPIDESIMKIPPGHMKFIDDTSDSTFIREPAEENEFSVYDDYSFADYRIDAQHAYLKSVTSEVIPVHAHNFNIKTNVPVTKVIEKSPSAYSVGVDSGIESLYGTLGLGNVSRTCYAQDPPGTASTTHVSTLSVRTEKGRAVMEIASNACASKYTVKKSNILELPPRGDRNKNAAKTKPEPPQKSTMLNPAPGNLNNCNANTQRSKFAQFASGRPLIPLVCSPKTLKKRNVLLAKRRDVSLKELGHADCEGWLLHRCRWSGTGASLGTTWTRAWFILKGSIFYGFKSPHASKANIMISLPGFTAAIADEVKSKKFAFKVYHTGTVFYFAAESEQMLALWLESITAGTVLQDSCGKILDLDDILFSETDEDSDHEEEVDSGTCFPTSKTKFGGLLGSSSSPNTSRSQQNLASETKIHEVQKKFGSLKKLGRKVTDMSGSTNTSHSDGSNSSSLDRKYLCFLGSSRNSTVPVPTAQFRSYRRVANSTPSKTCNETSGLTNRGMACVPPDIVFNLEPPFKRGHSSCSSTGRTAESLEIMKPKQEKENLINISNFTSNPNSESNRGKEKDTARCSVANKGHHSDRLLRPAKISDVRDRSTHASNPTLQLSGDMCDYRLAAERLRAFNSQRKHTREDTSGFVTLEEFMLSRQEEERRAEQQRLRAHDEKSDIISHRGNEVMRQSSFNSTISSKSSPQDAYDFDASHSPESCCRAEHTSLCAPAEYRRATGGTGQLKSVAQYQPPPVAQLDDSGSQPLALAFEMHLGEKEASSSNSSSKTASKLRSIFTSSKSQGRHHKQNLDVPQPPQSDSWPKTLLGSPRLHRALFRDRNHSSPAVKGGSSSSSESNCSSISPPIVTSPPDWAMDPVSDACLAQTKPTMGVSMLGKRPTRRAPAPFPTQPASAPTSTPPDYPGLEYPPVFEPETYTLADASSLRARPSRAHSDK